MSAIPVLQLCTRSSGRIIKADSHTLPFHAGGLLILLFFLFLCVFLCVALLHHPQTTGAKVRGLWQCGCQHHSSSPSVTMLAQLQPFRANSCLFIHLPAAVFSTLETLPVLTSKTSSCQITGCSFGSHK